MFPILRIVPVKFLSGRLPVRRRRVCSFLFSAAFSHRTSRQEWSTFRGQTDADGTSATAADDTLLTRLPQEWHILRKELF